MYSVYLVCTATASTTSFRILLPCDRLLEKDGRISPSSEAVGCTTCVGARSSRHNRHQLFADTLAVAEYPSERSDILSSGANGMVVRE
jgi:hypothetical protein